MDVNDVMHRLAQHIFDVHEVGWDSSLQDAMTALEERDEWSEPVATGGSRSSRGRSRSPRATRATATSSQDDLRAQLSSMTVQQLQNLSRWVVDELCKR